MPNGRILELKDMRATDATLDFTTSGTIIMHITMSSGKAIDQSAKMVSSQVFHGKGDWIAKWPDIRYPLRADISIAGDLLTSDTSFDDRPDAERVESSEHAVLRKGLP